MKLRQVDNIPNFYRDEASQIYYVRRMVNGRVVWRSTHQTARKAALDRAHELLAELRDRKVGWEEKDIPTLSEWWSQYRAAKKKSPRTWKREETIMELHWLPQFGRLGLNEITQNQVERQLNWRRKKGAAEGTVTREQSLLHTVFEAAVDDDLIEKNPLRKLHQTPYKTRERVISTEEQASLLAVMSPMLGRWFKFMLGTGLRVAEAQGIRSAVDIDWVGKTIAVVGKGHNGEPRPRVVPLLSDVLVDILKTQIAENNGPDGRFRSDRSEKVWGQRTNYWGNELRGACRRAGIPSASPHVCRHTFATRYLKSGGSLYVLSKILGHRSVKTTERVYAHLMTKDYAKLSQGVELGLVGA